jgi:hypothetical protein
VSTPAKAVTIEAWHRMRTDIETRESQCTHSVRSLSWPSLSSSRVVF